MITFNGKINTNVEEKVVFEAFKRFMIEQFQEFEFNVSGKNVTLNHKQNK